MVDGRKPEVEGGVMRAGYFAERHATAGKCEVFRSD
jgi:hypothetical protein